MAGLPLENVRVIDLSWVWAGPVCTRILADMGAQVIKVEATKRPDRVRALVLAENDPAGEPWNRGGAFIKRNLNKLGLTLDLTHPRGVELFKRLVRLADVVAESYSPRVTRNLGLDYPVLREIKPDIIMVSLSGYGQTGPYRNFSGFGMGLEPASGFSALTGYPGGRPQRTRVAITDPLAGVTGAGAVLMALYHRRRTGQGQYIDLAQREAAMPFIGEFILDYVMNRRLWPRLGNRHPRMAPHGCYRCHGEDNWVVIAVSSEEEWQALCQALGNPSWCREERFATMTARLAHQDELDPLIAEWTRQHDHYRAMHLLQQAGVPAGAVLNAKEILLEPHHKERGFFKMAEHPVTGKRPYPRQVPARFSRTEPGEFRAGPLLGQHNALVLGELLGLSGDELRQLEEEKVIGTVFDPTGGAAMRNEGFNLAAMQRVGAVVGVDPDYKERLGLT